MRTTAPLSALLAAVLSLCAPSAATACIWDSDTLAMERAKFPEVNELIAGYFSRHSKAYYQWRADKILARDQNKWTPGDYDDLGASYDKLGQHDKAIATILDKIKRFPDKGTYESQANLGTFYIHAGELEKGLAHIDKAIKINPDAHFGREVYQKLLVQYVIQQRKAGDTLPLYVDDSKIREEKEGDPPRSAGFAEFIFEKQGIDRDDQEEEIKRAIKGVLGMMRFGSHDSPILLEALGDLLQTQAMGHGGSQRLTARAYLKASYEAEDPKTAERYREKAKSGLTSQSGEDLSSVERDLKEEIKKGDAYFEEIEEKEKGWIEAGKDVDAEFKKAYYDQPKDFAPSAAELAAGRMASLFDFVTIAIIVGLGVILLIFVGIPALIVIVVLRRKAKARAIG